MDAPLNIIGQYINYCNPNNLTPFYSWVIFLVTMGDSKKYFLFLVVENSSLHQPESDFPMTRPVARRDKSRGSTPTPTLFLWGAPGLGRGVGSSCKYPTKVRHPTFAPAKGWGHWVSDLFLIKLQRLMLNWPSAWDNKSAQILHRFCIH